MPASTPAMRLTPVGRPVVMMLAVCFACCCPPAPHATAQTDPAPPKVLFKVNPYLGGWTYGWSPGAGYWEPGTSLTQSGWGASFQASFREDGASVSLSAEQSVDAWTGRWANWLGAGFELWPYVRGGASTRVDVTKTTALAVAAFCKQADQPGFWLSADAGTARYASGSADDSISVMVGRVDYGLPQADSKGLSTSRSWTGLSLDLRNPIEHKGATYYPVSPLGFREEANTDINGFSYEYGGRLTGSCSASNKVEFTVRVDGIPKPSITAVTPVSSTALNLTWTYDGPPIEGFRIQRKTATTNWLTVATRPASARAWPNTGLKPNTTYTYRMLAYKGTEQSEWSDPKDGTTPDAKPKIYVAPASIALHWSGECRPLARVSIKNVGDDGSRLTGTVTSNEPQFSILMAGNTFSLEKGQTKFIYVAMSPTIQQGIVQGQLIVESNDHGRQQVTIPMGGTVYGKRSPDHGRFGYFYYRDLGGDDIEIEPCWKSQNLVTIYSPLAKSKTCHRLAAPNFEKAFAMIASDPYLAQQYHSDAGIWDPRYKRNLAHIPDNLSEHAWGTAIDINVPTNSYGQDPSDDNIILWVYVFRHLNFKWGAEWLKPKDPMHFEVIWKY